MSKHKTTEVLTVYNPVMEAERTAAENDRRFTPPLPPLTPEQQARFDKSQADKERRKAKGPMVTFVEEEKNSTISSESEPILDTKPNTSFVGKLCANFSALFTKSGSRQ